MFNWLKTRQRLLSELKETQKISRDLKKACVNHRKSQEIYTEVLSKYKEIVATNSETIEILLETLEGTKVTLDGILGMNESDHDLNTLADMVATYVFTLEDKTLK